MEKSEMKPIDMNWLADLLGYKHRCFECSENPGIIMDVIEDLIELGLIDTQSLGRESTAGHWSDECKEPEVGPI